MTTYNPRPRLHPLTLRDIHWATVVYVVARTGPGYRVDIGNRACLLPPSEALLEVLATTYPTRDEAADAARVVFPNANIDGHAPPVTAGPDVESAEGGIVDHKTAADRAKR